jgi:hypothetical protein
VSILYTEFFAYAIYCPMLGLRKFIQGRRLSTLLAIGMAYAFAVQALMASVGMGMSAFAAPDQDGLVICSHVPAPPQAPGGDGQKPGSAPQCPFCFVAAHSAGNLALTGDVSAFPAYSGLPVARVSDRIGRPAFVAQSYRTVGVPRAPPVFSV